MIRLISTDFDGTLYADHEDPPVPKDLQVLLERLQANGVRWVINTGRDLASLMAGLGRAGLTVQPDFVVCVEREIFQREESHFVSLETWNQRCRKAHVELFARVRPDVPRLTQWIVTHHPSMVYDDAYSPLCVIAPSVGFMNQIQTHLEEYCSTVPGLAVMRNDVYCRFNHADFNKGTALAEVARMVGVTPEETLAAGDHLNDLPMLSRQVAHLLVAPRNSELEVLHLVGSQGGYLSQQPWGHGVARGIEHFLAQVGPQLD